jgi:hypothetical protein
MAKMLQAINVIITLNAESPDNFFLEVDFDF